MQKRKKAPYNPLITDKEAKKTIKAKHKKSTGLYTYKIIICCRVFQRQHLSNYASFGAAAVAND